MMENDPTPGISPATRLVERDLALLIRALEALYRRRKYPLERSQYLILLMLRDGPRRVGELAELLGLDQSTATRQVASLERAGLAVRTADPADGRSMLIVVTETGRARCTEMQEARLARLNGLLADWPEEERLQFAGHISRLIDTVIRDAGKEDTPAPQTSRPHPEP